MSYINEYWNIGSRVLLVDPQGTTTVPNGRLAYSTVQSALANATSGDVVLVMPGTYTLPSGITIPTGVQLRGLSTSMVVLSMAVSADTTMVTMSNGSVLRDLTLNLTSTDHFNLTGVSFPGTTTESARLVDLIITVDNSSASNGGTSNVYGVLSSGTGQPTRDVVNLRGCVVTVKSAGLGTKRGYLANAGNKSNMKSNSIVCRRTGTGLGSYIGIETNHASAITYCAEAFTEGFSSDISQTLGSLIYGGTLNSGTTNNTPIESSSVLPFLIFADSGGAPSNAIRYMRPGTGAVSANEIKIQLPQAGTANSITVRALTGPGGIKVDTWTVRKNGVDTALVASLTGAETFKKVTFGVPFAIGDDISVKLVTANASATSDIVVLVDFIK